MTRDVLEGLSAPDKSVSPKYFYDDRSKLLNARTFRVS